MRQWKFALIGATVLVAGRCWAAEEPAVGETTRTAEVATASEAPSEVVKPPSETQEEEEESGPSIGAELDFNSRYVWRGIAFTKGAVLQPSIWYSNRDVTFSLWGNNNLFSSDGRRFNEVDLSVSYSREWKGFGFEPSFVLYTYYGDDAPTTGESAVKISRPVGSATAYWLNSIDVVKYSGAYYGELGLSYEKELSATGTLSTGIGLGWGSKRFNEVYVQTRKSALNSVNARLSCTWKPNKNLYVRPHVEFSSLLDGRLRDAVDDANVFNFGIAIGREF